MKKLLVDQRNYQNLLQEFKEQLLDNHQEKIQENFIQLNKARLKLL